MAKESRLIDADNLEANLRFLSKERLAAQGIDAVLDVIGRQYVIDAVPVVRCRDCVHYCEDGACTAHAIVVNGVYATEYVSDGDYYCADGSPL